MPQLTTPPLATGIQMFVPNMKVQMNVKPVKLLLHVCKCNILACSNLHVQNCKQILAWTSPHRASWPGRQLGSLVFGRYPIRFSAMVEGFSRFSPDPGWDLEIVLSRPARKADNLTAPSVSRLSRENVGAATSHNPMGPHGLLQG
jgi:hypothetical protein